MDEIELIAWLRKQIKKQNDRAEKNDGHLRFYLGGLAAGYDEVLKKIVGESLLD